MDNSNSVYNNGQNFNNSNDLISKFTFLILVLFGYIILLHIGARIIKWIFGPKQNVKLLSGMIDAKQQITFSQDPQISNSKTIYRSVNKTSGIEFSWSTWIYVDDLEYLNGRYKHIFSKGNDAISNSGLNFPNNAPGLYIAPNTNELVVIMNTYNVINEEIKIPDIPLNKWINVIIRCENTDLDVYINGSIVKSHKLHGVPKQNYGDVYVCLNGGFSGNLSNLFYYGHGLSISEIQKISQVGPNLKVFGDSGIGNKTSDYLSLRWFFNNY